VSPSLAASLNSFTLLDTQITALDILRLRGELGAELLAMARAKGIGQSYDEVTIRDLDYNLDLGGASNDWVTAAATVAGTWYVFVNSALASNKACVIYGFWSRDAVPNIMRVRLQATGGGATYGDYDVSGIYSTLNQVCYFSTPIIYGPTSTVYVTLYPRAAATSQSGLLGLVIEPQGEHLTRSVF
jgi:hypothetical protein